MESRRPENYAGGESPPAKSRTQRHQLGNDSYPISHHDFPDRSYRRSLSPRSQGGLRRDLDREGRSTSVERRDYGWRLGGTRDEHGRSISHERKYYAWQLGSSRTEQVQSRSPPQGHIQKRPHFDEEIVGRKREYPGPIEFEAGPRARVKHDYGYERDLGSRSIIRGNDYHDGRIAGIHGHRPLLRRPARVEERDDMISYPLRSDPDPSLDYRESGRHIPPNSCSRDSGRSDIGIRYQDTGNTDRLPLMDTHKGGKPVLHPRDVSYNVAPKSYSKDFAGSSSDIVPKEHLGSFQDGIPLPGDEYVRTGADSGAIGDSAYSQSHLVETAKNYETKRKTVTNYQEGLYSPSRAEFEDHRYVEPQVRVNDDHVYLPDNSYNVLHSNSPSSYGHNQVDFDRRDCLEQVHMRPIVECCRNGKAEDYFGDPRSSNLSEKLPTMDYPEFRKTYSTSIQHEDYMNSGRSHTEFGRRVSQNHELTHLNTSQGHQFSHSRSNHLDRYADQEIQKERPLEMSQMARYDPERHRLHVRSERMEEELGLYDSLHNMPRIAYSMEEDITGYDSRRNMSAKHNELRDFDYPYDDEWIDDDISDPYSHRTGLYGYNDDREEAAMSYDRQYCRDDRTYDERFSPQGSKEHLQHHPARLYNHGHKYIKHYPKSRSSTWYNSSQYNRKGGFYKQKNVLKRKEYHHEDEVYDGEVLEDWNSAAKLDLSEDCDEFKQLVHEAFLTYSKMLNANPSVQRRYMELGKAGTLFCIVCGRSHSKEFMDTQRLAKHALMSNRPGLRAEHWGLHKAICVLMGWDSNPPLDILNWAPQRLSSAEALVQKEDLILWPPVVVVHNISALKKNQNQQEVITPEMLEVFLRGKGFVDGKIKVCQGKHADGSLMVVKFLGTFTGLGNTEKIHRYFADNKHGRKEFERLVSKDDKISSSSGGELQKDREELDLYGYMGLSEDLDKLDFHSKRSAVIKSKTEILDVANAPVKAEER